MSFEISLNHELHLLQIVLVGAALCGRPFCHSLACPGNPLIRQRHKNKVFLAADTRVFDRFVRVIRDSKSPLLFSLCALCGKNFSLCLRRAYTSMGKCFVRAIRDPTFFFVSVCFLTPCFLLASFAIPGKNHSSKTCMARGIIYNNIL